MHTRTCSRAQWRIGCAAARVVRGLLRNERATLMAERSRTLAQLLGYGDDARLLIINADDFGMCHAENVATIAGLEQGAFCSATIMVPCPWFAEVAGFAARTPAADLGVHIP